MTKLEQIKKDSMVALKDGDKFKRQVINNFLSEMKNEDFSEDAKFNNFLNKFIKKLSDSRPVLVERGKDTTDLDNEISILKSYAPKMLSDDEVINLIKENCFDNIKDAMCFFKEKYNGLVDNGNVSKLFRELQK